MNIPAWMIGLIATLIMGSLSNWVRWRRVRKRVREDATAPINVRHSVIALSVVAVSLVLPLVIVGLVITWILATMTLKP